uniref:Uncharacterized protein n=1 Tax=Arundo donax TaxID=35708 RepID=A0A0A8Z9J9_ARUDO
MYQGEERHACNHRSIVGSFNKSARNPSLHQSSSSILVRRENSRRGRRSLTRRRLVRARVRRRRRDFSLGACRCSKSERKPESKSRKQNSSGYRYLRHGLCSSSRPACVHVLLGVPVNRWRSKRKLRRRISTGMVLRRFPTAFDS